MAKLSIRDLDVAGKRLFVRVDFNVPIEGGRIEDDTRVRASLPTIRFAIDAGATVVLASHLGRPKGKVTPAFSLRPVAAHLGGLLEREVVFAEDCVGEAARSAVARASTGDRVVLLENLRFHGAEERNEAAFADDLAALADRYVNDAFGSSHRAHASVDALPRRFERPAAGLLMERELRYLRDALADPDRPFVALLGGAKVSDKIDVIQSLLGRVDAVAIGGAMAYTFLKSRGLSVGRSLVEDGKLDEAGAILADAEARRVRLALPVDHVVAEALDPGAARETLGIADPAIGDRLGLDIGPATVREFSSILSTARTVVWNGPMGVFETPPFDAGTNAVALAVASVTGTTIVGGGDSALAVARAGVADRITHISTGGGASLELLGGLSLPGVDALAERA